MIGQDSTFTSDTNDQFGKALDSLPNRTSSFVTSTDYEANNDRNAVTNYNVRNISADKISAGTIVVSMNIGGPYITIDGSAQQILVNDGTTNRILIGYGSALF